MDKGEEGEGEGEEDKFVNPETVKKYELQVLVVTSDDGDLINLFPNLMIYDDAKRESSMSRLCGFQAIYRSKSDQIIITSNKLFQFLPVEIISNVKSVLLMWDHYVMERFPLEICGLKDLQELSIYSSQCKDSSLCLRHLPQEIGNLKNLRLLKISTFDCLKDLPSEIGNLENLEELVIYECNSLLQLPAKIGHLKRLQRLEISWCSRLKDLPSTIGNLESLEILSVDLCPYLTQFPSETSNLKRLRILNINVIATVWNGTEDFRLECTNLVNLQEMRIYYCECLVHLPQEIGNLRCLRKLWIENCDRLENLPSEIGNLENLQEMIIVSCPCIKHLPPEIGNLRCLRRLQVKRQKNSQSHPPLDSIPLEVGDLMSLQEFFISYAGCLDRLAIVINKLERHLQQMDIDYRGKVGLDHAEYFATPSSTGSVCFDLRFTMTLKELNFRVVGNIENLNVFLQSLAAEKSPSSPISLLLPQGIQRIIIENSYMQKKINQETIRKLLQKYPTLAMICSDEGKIFYHFTADTLHLMYLNRFVRSLQYEASESGDRSSPTLLAENVWPIILEEAQTRIQKDFINIAENTNLNNPITIGASVIYSIVRELALPLLLDN